MFVIISQSEMVITKVLDVCCILFKIKINIICFPQDEKNIQSKHSNGQISKLIILYEEEKGFPKTKEIFAINLPIYHSLRKLINYEYHKSKETNHE